MLSLFAMASTQIFLTLSHTATNLTLSSKRLHLLRYSFKRTPSKAGIVFHVLLGISERTFILAFSYVFTATRCPVNLCHATRTLNATHPPAHKQTVSQGWPVVLIEPNADPPLDGFFHAGSAVR